MSIQTKYPYPDGTTGSKRPNDGEMWKGVQGDTWMWDDFCGQWFKQTGGGTWNAPAAGNYQVQWDVSSGVGPLPMEELDLSKLKFTEYNDTGLIKCECGAEKCDSNKHSDWCKKYDSNQ